MNKQSDQLGRNKNNNISIYIYENVHKGGQEWREK